MNIIHEIYQQTNLITRTNRKQIWLARNILDGQRCVIKLQQTSELKAQPRNILHEGKFLQALQGYPGIPFLFWAGKEEKQGNAILVTQQLGSTIGELMRGYGKVFSLKTVCQIGIQIFKMLHALHDKGITHGNLNLESLQMGVGANSSRLYFNDLIDAGYYIRGGKHVKQFDLAKLRPKATQFFSAQRLQGHQCSRKDDIESIIYILVYLLKGQLPWSKLLARKSVQNELQAKMKKELEEQAVSLAIRKIKKISPQQLCKGLDNCFVVMLQSCRALQFDEKPDYNILIRSLQKLLVRKGLYQDGIYDWMKQNDRYRVSVKSASLLSIKLENEQDILQTCYLPYQADVHLQ